MTERNNENPREQDALNPSDGYRRLFEESRDAIYVSTLDGRLVDINPAGLELFGYSSKEEMLSLDIGRDLYWNPRDRRRARRIFEAQGFVEDLELELKSRDGRRIRVRETSTTIRDAAGQICGFRGILRDVTAERRLEEQLRQAQKMEAVGRLAGGVAHEFNNLLTAINGYSELLLARLDSNDPQRTPLGEIRKAGRRAADLTRRLLTLSRQQGASPRRLDLNRAVVEMEKLLGRVLGEDVELVTDLDPALGAVFADQSQIEQVILNLAVNARDAMPDGGRLELVTRAVELPGDGRTTVPPSKEGAYAHFRVSDTGLGMERDVREHAFEPFYTTKDKGQNTGLGLAIVYGVVRQLGGSVEIESREGQGTTVHLYLPLLDGAADVDRPSVSDPLPRGAETVLLVEDEDSVRRLVQQVLELQGYRVLSAESASAALELCGDNGDSPDLLLTDVVMPEKSGTALAEDLRLRYADLKILFMSGYTDRHNGVRLAERRAAFLPKPFSPELLAQKVREVLDAPAG